MKDRVAGGGAGRPPFGFAFALIHAPLTPPAHAAPRPRAPSPESRPLSPLSHPHTSSRGRAPGPRAVERFGQPKEVLPRGLSRDVHPASGMLSSRARRAALALSLALSRCTGCRIMVVVLVTHARDGRVPRPEGDRSQRECSRRSTSLDCSSLIIMYSC